MVGAVVVAVYNVAVVVVSVMIEVVGCDSVLGVMASGSAFPWAQVALLGQLS